MKIMHLLAFSRLLPRPLTDQVLSGHEDHAQDLPRVFAPQRASVPALEARPQLPGTVLRVTPQGVGKCGKRWGGGGAGMVSVEA